jgi:hypothetical protein
MSDWLRARLSAVASWMEDLGQAGLLVVYPLLDHLLEAYLLVEVVVPAVDRLALTERLAQDPPATMVLEARQRLNRAATRQRQQRVD